MARRSIFAAVFIAWATVGQAQTYPEMVGMFSHAAGAIESGGQTVSYWAWNHHQAPSGCSDLHWGVPTGWVNYERFCVVGEWVRLMGWSVGPEFLRLTVDGEPGQPYAKIDARDSYSYTVDVDVWRNGVIAATYTDAQMWAPTTTGGWSQSETFRWKADIGAGCAFQSFSTFTSRKMFATAHQTFIGWDGAVTQPPPARTSVTWTW